MPDNCETDIFQLLETATSVCRFCFSKLEPGIGNCSVFEEDVLRIVQFCCGNVLLTDTDLPNCICITCHSDLQSSYKFLGQFNYSQDVLKKYLDKRDTLVPDGETPPGSISDHPRAEVEDFIDEVDKDVLLQNKTKFRRSAPNNRNRIRRNGKRPPAVALNKYNCPSCDKKYRSNFELEVHVRLHTGEKPFTCSVCGKTFIDNRNLKRHEKIHTGDKDHECSVCHRKFLHLFSLKTHERIHRGEKKYVCEICGKSFNTCGELRVHYRIHTKEKPYTCSICEKAFSSKAALNIHTRIHTGDRRYGCLVCDRKCRTASDLKVHVRSHNGEKPYRCKYANCDKRYKNSSQFNVHLRTHTGEKHHECQVCYKKFGEANTLKRHLVTHEKAPKNM